MTELDERVVNGSDIERELSKLVNIPEERVSEKQNDTLANPESNMKGAVYGQDNAPSIDDITDKIIIAQVIRTKISLSRSIVLSSLLIILQRQQTVLQMMHLMHL